LQPIWQQIAEPLLLHQGMQVSAAKMRALELLERVQLSRAKERLLAYPHQLSGGQRQRVMIAMALACGPDILIADEPTTALDVTVQKEVLALISQLVSEDGMGLLLISHDLGLMQDQVDRVMVMYGGAVVETAPTDQLFRHRRHPYTQGLFAARPQLGLKRGTRLTTIPGQVPELSNWPTACAFADRCTHAIDACREVHPPLIEGEFTFAPNPEWIRILEFYCPGCGTQIETEYLPPGHPITHTTEIDLDSLKRRLAAGELRIDNGHLQVVEP
jgi:peptide/nickel transport system ATP-binding protein